MSTYGRKGGDGPTAGKKRALYEVVLPDGTNIQKPSFKVTDEKAIAVCYEHKNAWFVSAIVSPNAIPDWVKAGGYGGKPYTLINVTRS